MMKMNTKKIASYLLEKRSIVILVILLLCACLFTTEFLKPSNLSNVLLQVATDGIVAVGVTFIVHAGVSWMFGLREIEPVVNKLKKLIFGNFKNVRF